MNTMLHRLIVASLFVSASMARLQAQPAPEEAGQSLWELIAQGGWAMWPLGLCCLLLFFLALYGWRETALSKFVPRSQLSGVAGALQAQELPSALQALQATDTVLARAIHQGWGDNAAGTAARHREKVEQRITESLEADENTLGQWVNYLNVIAAVAPMIGLLGTVSGMISAFQTISLGGMGRPELLAGDIGEALITTATGLAIGIPAMVLYFILKNRLGSSLLATTQAANELLEAYYCPHQGISRGKDDTLG